MKGSAAKDDPPSPLRPMRGCVRLRVSGPGLLAALLALAGGAGADDTALSPGIVVERVACAKEPSQTYALYLPSAYHPDRRWPVLYAFDPMARGRVAVETFREAAERLGVVVVGSNNSRNGPLAPVVAAIEAAWRDTHTRFSLDPARVYASGMSGGAEAALLVGRSKGAGVIACASPIEAERLTTLDARLAWVGIAGDADFCFDPTKGVVEALAGRGLTAWFTTFEGRHGWPPAELAGRALEFLALVSSRVGNRPRDEALVASWHAAGLARVRGLESEGRHDAAADECAALGRALTGLLPSKTTDALKAESVRLGAMPEAKAGRKREKARSGAERNESARLYGLRQRLERGATSSELPWAPEAGGSRDEGFAPRAGLDSAISRLAHRAASDDPEARVVAWRVLDGFFIDTYATALERRASGQLETAEALFDLCGKVRPESAAAAYEKARTLAARGESKRALGELRRAVGLGFRDGGRLRTEPEWSALRELPGFRSLLDELAAPSPPSQPRTALEPKLREKVAAFRGEMGLFARDLETGETVAVNADTRFPAASVIKLAVMAEVERRLAEGTLSADTTATLRDADKVGEGTPLNALHDGTVLSVADLERLMIAWSDNTATNLLVGLVGTKSVNVLLDAHGLRQTRLYRPTFRDGRADVLPEEEEEFGLGSTTPREAAGLMERIADGRIAGRAASERMVAILSAQQDRAMIPRSLPFAREPILVANKTGWDEEKRPDARGFRGDVRGDVAYVKGPRGRYVIAILARRVADKDPGLDSEALRTGAELARLVYEAFQGRD